MMEDIGMEDVSYLSREQLRYIRRSSHSKTFKPEEIFHMIDLIIKLYDHAKHSFTTTWFEKTKHDKYRHDIEYILGHFPCLEVHSYVANRDPKFMHDLYSTLECMTANYGKYEQMSEHNKVVYNRYLAIEHFVPLVKAQIILVS